MTNEELETKYHELDAQFKSLLSKYQEVDRKMYTLHADNGRVLEKLERLLEYFNLKMEWVSGWRIERRRKIFK